MNKKVGVLIVILACAVVAMGFYSIVRLIIIKNKGLQIAATVSRVDTDCDRYNYIDVVYKGKTYIVTISVSDCQDGVYKVGQSVTLIKYKDDDNLIWPEAQPEWLLLLLIVVMALSYYTNKESLQRLRSLHPTAAL